MTIASKYTPGPEAEDITIEKDGGILKEILVMILYETMNQEKCIERVLKCKNCFFYCEKIGCCKFRFTVKIPV